MDANHNVVREGIYLNGALPHNQNQIGQAAPQEQHIEPSMAQKDESEMLAAAKDFDDTNRIASTDIAVYQWYFAAAGRLNFVVFLVLCAIFVVGAVYPRTTRIQPYHLRFWDQNADQVRVQRSSSNTGPHRAFKIKGQHWAPSTAFFSA